MDPHSHKEDGTVGEAERLSLVFRNYRPHSRRIGEFRPAEGPAFPVTQNITLTFTSDSGATGGRPTATGPREGKNSGGTAKKNSSLFRSSLTADTIQALLAAQAEQPQSQAPVHKNSN